MQICVRGLSPSSLMSAMACFPAECPVTDFTKANKHLMPKTCHQFKSWYPENFRWPYWLRSHWGSICLNLSKYLWNLSAYILQRPDWVLMLVYVKLTLALQHQARGAATMVVSIRVMWNPEIMFMECSRTKDSRTSSYLHNKFSFTRKPTPLFKWSAGH